jgi:hypothetical protein
VSHPFDHRGREEEQRSCYGTQADGYERGARSGLDIRSGKWRRWIETERFRHVMPPENLEIDGVPAEYPDNSANPSEPSDRQVSGSWHYCMGLVYHWCRPASAHTDSMPVRLDRIVVDAHDLPGLARFRAQAPGWEVRLESRPIVRPPMPA